MKNEKIIKGWRLFDYYQWLLERIDGHKEPYYNYSLLLNELHNIEFTWSIERDENRAFDGKELRFAYMDEENVPDIFYKEAPCSVLEALIGLSLRCYEDIMWGDEKFHEADLFWIMIENLGLMKCDDEHFSRDYIHQQVNKWLSREFKYDGEGSIFPLKHVHRDQRKVEIWLQMCGYLNEYIL